MMDRLHKLFSSFGAQPGERRGRVAKFLRLQVELWRFCARRLRENNVMAMSAALSFRTIFAMVPALVLAFLMAKSLGVLEDSKQSLRRFLETSGFAQIAALGEPEGEGQAPRGEKSSTVINVADEIERLVGQVEGKLTFKRIGPIGGALLIWTALTLLTTLERSLNRVFAASRSRSLVRRILLYWSVMTLGPVVLALVIYASRSAVTTFASVHSVAWLVRALGWLSPVIVGMLLLTLLYMLLPNTAVGYRAAAAGATAAVLMWLAAKWAFAVYVERLVIKGNLYGVLGVLPLFLMWLNLSWLIILFGAQLAHTTANLEKHRLSESERRFATPADTLAAALVVAQRFESGEGWVSLDRLASALQLSADATARLAEDLVTHEILCPVSGRAGFILACPAARLRIIDILAVADATHDPASNGHDTRIAAAVAELQTRMRAPISELTLADVLLRM